MNESHDTRLALIESARALFARHGYDGTSIKVITSRAQANLGAVTYHFGTKKKLYHAVLRSVAEPFLARLKSAAGEPGAPLDRIERFVRTFFSHLADNSEMPSLLMHELSLSRPLPPPLREIMGQVFGTVVGLIKAGQKDGSIVDGDPRLLVISVLALPAYVTWIRVPLGEVAGLNSRDRRTRSRILDHIVASTRRSLAAGTRPHADSTAGAGRSRAGRRRIKG